MIKTVTSEVTYCTNDDCPFRDCARHFNNLYGRPRDEVVSTANLGGVCRRYIQWLVKNVVGDESDIPMHEKWRVKR